MINVMKIRIIFIVIVAILSLTLGSVWLYAQKSSALPLTWTPKQVVEFVLPSTNRTVTVSFKANTNLSNVSFFLTPAIRDIVSISPTQFTNISAGQNYQVTLSIRPGSISGLKLDGTVQLKDSLNRATNALPLPITIVVHNEPVPPDPGEFGKVTLEGIDSDNDGVRDDIQRWIILNYLNSEKRRAVLRQDAKVFQSFILDADDKKLSISHANNMQRVGECEDYIFGTLDESMQARLYLESQIVNTEERSRAYIKANSQLGGTFGLVIQKDQRKAQCAFDPDSMAN